MPYGSPSKAETRPASSCTGKYLKRYTWLETSGRRTCFLRIGHIVNSVILVIRAVVKNMFRFEPFIIRKIAANGTCF